MIVPLDAEADESQCTATGRVREVVYLGAITRYIVELDDGGELVVMQQNLTTKLDGGTAGPRQGRSIALGSKQEGEPIARRRCCARADRGGVWRRYDVNVVAVVVVLLMLIPVYIAQRLAGGAESQVAAPTGSRADEDS